MRERYVVIRSQCDDGRRLSTCPVVIPNDAVEYFRYPDSAPFESRWAFHRFWNAAWLFSCCHRQNLTTSWRCEAYVIVHWTCCCGVKRAAWSWSWARVYSSELLSAQISVSRRLVSITVEPLSSLSPLTSFAVIHPRLVAVVIGFRRRCSNASLCYIVLRSYLVVIIYRPGSTPVTAIFSDVPVMGKLGSWSDLNHDWILCGDLIWLHEIWFESTWCDLEFIRFHRDLICDYLWL